MQKEEAIARRSLLLSFACVLFLFCCDTASAAPRSAGQARKAVAGWLTGDVRPLGADIGRQIGRLRAFTDQSGRPAYYVVHLKPTGLVVVSADDEIEPIIAFSKSDDYESLPSNPLFSLVNRDVRARKKNLNKALIQKDRKRNKRRRWNELVEKGESGDSTTTLSGMSTPSDIRVRPLLQTAWGQSVVCNDDFFNYYTPGNYRTGCVATAMAQLMRHHRYPTAGVGYNTFTIWVDGRVYSAYTLGGNGQGDPYNWSAMVPNPDCGYSESQRISIATLCHDAGISVNTKYSSVESTSDTLKAADALKETFGYGHAVKGYNDSRNIGSGLIAMINPNLDAGDPVILGINGETGHAAVCDGYGYIGGTMYHHLNMGWGGSGDAWYNLPNIDSSPAYSSVHKCIYNIRVTSDGGEVVSGRVLDHFGRPVPNPTVYALAQNGGYYFTARSNERGIYAFDNLDSATDYTILPLVQGFIFRQKSIRTGISADNEPFSGNIWGLTFVAEPLQISTVTPSEGPTGSRLRISGRNFGDEPGQVIFPVGRKARVIDWSDTVVYCSVPDGAVSGGVRIETAEMNLSTSISFSVTDPCEIIVDRATYTPNIENGSDQFPFGSIAAALSTASEGDVITVEPGTYWENLTFPGPDITLTSRDPNDSDCVASTVIDANGAGSAVIFDKGESPDCTLTGFTITGGRASSGGALHCSASDPTISRCNFVANQADGSGGALWINDFSFPTVFGCSFSNNAAAYGGAIANEISAPGISDCIFVDNSASRQGGAIYSEDDSEPLIRNCDFTGNHADDKGGAIVADQGAALVVDCTFSKNTANGRGGALYLSHSPSSYVNCRFVANRAEDDGGAAAIANGSPTMIGCVFALNTAGDCGGAAYNWNRSAPAILNCTIAGNFAPNTGGIYSNFCNPVIANSIIYGNGDNSGDRFQAQLSGGKPSIDYCCVEGLGEADIGQGNISDDPLFLQPPGDGGDGIGIGDNDYPGDLRLASGSPCLDAGDNSIYQLPADSGEHTVLTAPRFDVEGLPRKLDAPAAADTGVGQDPLMDIGAHEYASIVSHWKLDESAGNTAFDAAGENDGTLANGPVQLPGYGRFGGSVFFDSQDDYISISNEDQFDFRDAVTVSAWINPVSVDKNWMAIVTKGDSAWRLSFFQKQRRIHFAVTGPPEYYSIESQTQIPTGNWTHVCGTYDGRYMRVYVNGIEDPASPVRFEGDITTNDRNVFIGENSEKPGRVFNGMIDDVRIYNYALSADQVRRLQCEYPSKADINNDCRVDMRDLAILGADWLHTGTAGADIAPGYGDGRVDTMDLAAISQAWLSTGP